MVIEKYRQKSQFVYPKVDYFLVKSLSVGDTKELCHEFQLSTE